MTSDSRPVGSRGRRILVVDDNEDVAGSLAMVLRHMGNTVFLAYNGKEAIARATEQRPEVILLDIGLPDISGYETCRKIRETLVDPSPIILALTGWGQEEDKRLSREAGFDRHLVKPVTPQSLEKLISELLA